MRAKHMQNAWAHHFVRTSGDVGTGSVFFLLGEDACKAPNIRAGTKAVMLFVMTGKP
jgi:hypothetical protein